MVCGSLSRNRLRRNKSCCVVRGGKAVRYSFRYSTFGRQANRTLKNLLLPSRESVPSWVNDSVSTAVRELSRDLSEFIGEQ